MAKTVVELVFVTPEFAQTLFHEVQAHNDERALRVLRTCQWFQQNMVATDQAACVACENPFDAEWPAMIAVGLLEGAKHAMVTGMCVACHMEPDPRQRFEAALGRHGLHCFSVSPGGSRSVH